jgi:hypothetical protein
MIVIKHIDDVVNVPVKYRVLVMGIVSTLFDGVWNPTDNGYFIFLEETDTLDDLPHLNKEDGGLYCRDELGVPGLGWEDVKFHEKECLYEILILCNNEFGITYFIPAEHAPMELRSSLDESVFFKILGAK